MPIFELDELKPREIAPNFFAKLIHSETLSFSFVESKAGSKLPEHSHVNEQYSYVLDGEIEMTIGEEKMILNKNKFAVIPSNVKHSAIVISDCKILDVFYPVRQEYK
jgi:quercetin dioxygenase-like cupin family protein